MGEIGLGLFVENSTDSDQYVWEDVYEWAEQNNRVLKREIGGWKFEYVPIKPQDFKDKQGNPIEIIDDEKHRFAFDAETIIDLIEKAEKENRDGIPEGGHAFVLENQIPEKFLDFVGLHEYIEATLPLVGGAYRHVEACLVETTEVLKRDPAFVERYAQWLLGKIEKEVRLGNRTAVRDGYFGRALGNPFVDYLMKPTSPYDPSAILNTFHSGLEAKFKDRKSNLSGIQAIKAEFDREVQRMK